MIKTGNVAQLIINNGVYELDSDKRLTYNGSVVRVPEALRPYDLVQGWDVYNKIRLQVTVDGYILTTENALPTGNVRTSIVWVIH